MMRDKNQKASNKKMNLSKQKAPGTSASAKKSLTTDAAKKLGRRPMPRKGK
jgi:hypothetical protein